MGTVAPYRARATELRALLGYGSAPAPFHGLVRGARCARPAAQPHHKFRGARSQHCGRAGRRRCVGQGVPTTTDLQRPRTDDENVRRCAVNLNGRLAYHVRVGKTEFTDVRSYVNDLLRQGREMAGGEA